jgi:uncharacterized cupredoxin-like copper-binding protein
MTKSSRIRVRASSIVLSVASALAGCGGGGGVTDSAVGTDAAPVMTTVNVDLAEFMVTPDVAVAPAGLVTFIATNNGTMIHEMVVVKTDLAPDALPTLADGSVDEAALDSPGEISEFDPGMTSMVTLDLAAGNYVLFCNVVLDVPPNPPMSHYALGMYTGFTVQ